MYPAWHWMAENLDRILAFIAIVIAAIAMIDVRRLFKELESRDKNAEQRIREAVLKELLMHTASFATFSRAAQFIEFKHGQPDRGTAIAMLMAFRFQQLLDGDMPKEASKLQRQKIREKIEKEAAVWAKLIIDIGMGTLKEGWEFNTPTS